MEPFIYLVVFLFLTGLLAFMRWLNERLREEINLKDLFKQEEAPRTRHPPTQPKPVLLPTRERAPSPPRRERPLRGSALLSALHRKENLRQGIILMTILGPCRALDPPSRNRPFQRLPYARKR